MGSRHIGSSKYSIREGAHQFPFTSIWRLWTTRYPKSMEALWYENQEDHASIGIGWILLHHHLHLQEATSRHRGCLLEIGNLEYSYMFALRLYMFIIVKMMKNDSACTLLYILLYCRERFQGINYICAPLRKLVSLRLTCLQKNSLRQDALVV